MFQLVLKLVKSAFCFGRPRFFSELENSNVLFYDSKWENVAGTTLCLPILKGLSIHKIKAADELIDASLTQLITRRDTKWMFYYNYYFYSDTTGHFTIPDSQNPMLDAFELHEICRSTDFQAPEEIKSGTTIANNAKYVTDSAPDISNMERDFFYQATKAVLLHNRLRKRAQPGERN